MPFPFFRYGVCFHLFPTFSFSFLSLQTLLTSSPSLFFLFSIDFIPIFQFFGSSILFFVLSSLCSLWCCPEGCFFLKEWFVIFFLFVFLPPFFPFPFFFLLPPPPLPQNLFQVFKVVSKDLVVGALLLPLLLI